MPVRPLPSGVTICPLITDTRLRICCNLWPIFEVGKKVGEGDPSGFDGDHAVEDSEMMVVLHKLQFDGESRTV